jgi:hypothetical protein
MRPLRRRFAPVTGRSRARVDRSGPTVWAGLSRENPPPTPFPQGLPDSHISSARSPGPVRCLARLRDLFGTPIPRRHCEEAKPTKQSIVPHELLHGLLRYARNDGVWNSEKASQAGEAICSHTCGWSY